MLLDHLALVARGDCIPGSHGTLSVTIREDSSWQATTPRALHREQTETHPHPFCEKGLFTCPGASAWGAGFRFATHLEATEVHSGNVGWGTPSLYFPSASLQLAGTSQKRAYILIWSPNFCKCCPGNTWSHGLEASRIYDCCPTGVHILAYFKCCCLAVWFPISLKLGADWDSSFWNTDRSWHTFNNWDLSKTNQAT